MIELLVIVALVILNGLLSGAEIAILTLRKTRLRELLDAGRKSARSVRALRDQPERFLATVQVGITLVGTAAGAFGGASLAALIAPALGRLGLGAAAARDLALAIVIGFVTYLSVVFGELVPKSLALRYGEGYSLVIARPLRGLGVLMRPIVWFLTASSNAVLRLFGDRTSFTEGRLSRNELQQLVEEATKAGALDAQTGEIASRAFDFEELTVAAVMIPRAGVVAIPKGAAVDQIRRVLLESGHSRLPVYEGTLDQIVGYVLAKDVLTLAWERPTVIFEDILRPAYFVPETMRAVKVLKELQRRRMHLAIVVDDQGVLAGIVTIEDLVEELVGEIFSERELPAPLVQAERSGAYLIEGTAPVREVNRALGLEMEELEGSGTIAALCIALAGMIPTVGTRLVARDGTTLEIVEASPRRVRLVRVERPKPPAAEGATERWHGS